MGTQVGAGSNGVGGLSGGVVASFGAPATVITS